MVDCDYRLALQKATAPLHNEIDALFGDFDLAYPDGLARFLTAQAISLRACQPQITRFGEQRLGCTAPDYSQVLQIDMAILGLDTQQLPGLGLPLGSSDAGVFYVVAGSRLGAAVLRDRATALTLAGPAHSACGYFSVGDGPAMWRLFRQWLAGANGPTPDDLPAMIAAAKATFQLFAQAAQWAAAAPVPALLLPAGTRGMAA